MYHCFAKANFSQELLSFANNNQNADNNQRAILIWEIELSVCVLFALAFHSTSLESLSEMSLSEFPLIKASMK